jgi:hypothetical protein
MDFIPGAGDTQETTSPSTPHEKSEKNTSMIVKREHKRG